MNAKERARQSESQRESANIAKFRVELIALYRKHGYGLCLNSCDAIIIDRLEPYMIEQIGRMKVGQ